MKRIALIGYGYWGPNLLRNFFATENCEIVYVCDKDPKRLKEVRKRYPTVILTTEFSDLISDPEIDAIVIAAPTSFHYQLAKSAIESGKDVLVEKPMTLTSKEAYGLVGLARKNKKIIMVDHPFLFTEAVRRLKKIIKDGEIGNVIYIDSVRTNLGLFQKDASVAFDLASHDLSILLYLLGQDPISVISIANSYYGDQDEFSYLHLKFPKNVTCHIHVSWLSPLKVRKMMIVGTKKMIVYDDVEVSEKVRIYDKGVVLDKKQIRIGYRSGDMITPNLEIREALETLSREFIEAITLRKSPLSSGEFGLSIVEILEKAFLSVESGKTVLIKNASK